MAYLFVFLGGGLGAVARFAVGSAYVRAFGPSQPWIATGAVNILGGALMGALVGWLALRGGAASGERLRLLLGVGALGGFTTFSTFSLEVVGMVERRAYALAAVYALGSAALSVAALFATLLLVRRLAA